MTIRNRAAVAAVALAAMLGSAALAADPAMVGETAMGPVLTDAKGMTLYTFDKDTPGTSACTGACAANWPPLMAPSGAEGMGEYTVITRDDGSKQWAYKGKPLYSWVKDAKPGDTTGDGFKDVWHVAKP